LRLLGIVSSNLRPAPDPKESGDPLAQPPAMGSGYDDKFKEVFLRFYQPVLYYFRSYRFSEEEGHELTQETFLRVYKGWQRFRGESELGTWILQIARNIALNEIRSRATLKRDAQEVSLDEDWVADEGGGASGCIRERRNCGNPLEEALAAERRRILRSAVDDLPGQMRRCVLLRIDRELKYREIAELLQISIDTVKAHLFQARQHLKDKLADYFTDFDEL
jgi:RNA polymerase sigma-70 factor (ECF subfamily)